MSARLDALPKELLAHIASVAEPMSALHLSATCHAIRLACWSATVFRQNLVLSQQSYWHSSSLQITEIAKYAGYDTTIWAKYCVADQLIRSTGREPELVEIPEHYISYLPELFVAKHPFVYSQCWKASLHFRMDQRPSQVFCIAMGTLATNELLARLSETLQLDPTYGVMDDSWASSFLWDLCKIALAIRTGVRISAEAWPYNHAAMVPHIDLPTAEQIPLGLLSDEYRLPTPFSRRQAELIGKYTTSFSGWDSWYHQHNKHFLTSTDYLTQGSWCGYYVHFSESPLSPLDPPMTNIEFSHVADDAAAFLEYPDEAHPRRIVARSCVDGLDEFDLEASVWCSTDGIKLRARKEYINRQQHGWDWGCRLTPFGIVGYFGLRYARLGNDGTSLRRHGIVWLWRKEWTEKATG